MPDGGVAASAGGCLQKLLGAVGSPPGQWFELPPFHFVVRDEEVLDLVESLPVRLFQGMELGGVVRRLGDSDKAVIANGLAIFGLLRLKNTDQAGGDDGADDGWLIHEKRGRLWGHH